MTDVSPSAPRCEQCGMFHPPIPEGSKCPLADVIDEETGEKIDISKIIATMKSVLESQISIKKIKDLNKFQGELIVKITQFCEQYKEG